MHQAALLGQALQDSRKFGWQFTEEGKGGELFCSFVICAENPEVLFSQVLVALKHVLVLTT